MPFGSTRPIRPFAVLTAKMFLVLVVVLGIGVVGQAIALAANGVYGGSLLGRLPASAGTYGQWLLTAMVIAALTRDLKSFVVALVCVPIALAVASLGELQSARSKSRDHPAARNGRPCRTAADTFVQRRDAHLS
jgi:hypothetical protein